MRVEAWTVVRRLSPQIRCELINDGDMAMEINVDMRGK